MSRAYDNAADARFQQGGRRNLIINGAMQVAQRGTTGTQAVSYVIDRWRYNVSGSTGSVTQNTFTVGQTDVDPALEYYATFDVTAGNDNCNFQQRIEGVKRVPAGPVTVSFWAKGTNPADGTKVFLNQTFGSGGSSAVEITPQEITLTSSWQKFELTFTVPSISGKTVSGGDDSFRFNIGQHTSTSTAAYEINITGVQLEVGTVATPFEHRSYGEELALCQRYCVLLTNDDDTSEGMPIGARGFNTDQIECDVYFPAEMRTLPTLSQLGSGTNWRARYSNFNVDWTSFTWWTNSSRRGGLLYNGSLSGVTIGNCYRLERLTSGAYLIFDAEL
jgi:hypothetical protein